MKKVAASLLLLLLFSACNKSIQDNTIINNTNQQHPLLSAKDINSFIESEMQQKGSFDWKDASPQMVWSALQLKDKIMCVGYKPANFTDIENKITSIHLNDLQWKAAKEAVLDIIYKEEVKYNPSLRREDLEVWKENKLPVIDVKIESQRTIELLRQCPLVRYAEPMAYDPLAEEEAAAIQKEYSLIGSDGSGCGDYAGDADLVAKRDYTGIAPGTKMSWNFKYHNINKAWTKSTGAGVKVMVIDTGVSPDQDDLGSHFNQGRSTGRTIEKMVTLPGETSPDDLCGHGTTMSGAVAAPRGTDSNSVGVAYNCNFVICRAAHDVYLDESAEIKGVSDAYTSAADDADVKIISLSLGRITGNGQIKDAIQYAYNKGKLMFCAGGTSFNWTAGFVGVIFPASLSTVQAITGVKNTNTLKACSDCHKGKAIDFVVVMEQNATGIHQLSTALSGSVPTTVGGSSVSTATAAGIAALVWSKFPGYTREDVVNKLQTTASLYPNKNKNFGWGKLNADAATN
ncbi:serine protease [Ilyomonas limi]|uniref:Serine protease n=1 Tax=Ilyomonas limi TaxID=2575867 RepID=A0A4U3L0F6_9BACT|nr:S8/S53 family peptidase [Ilyomonas limi]TKK68300.1 serine protease [Ilyomonas limi]